MRRKVELVRRKPKPRAVFSVSEARATMHDRYEAAKNGERQGISHYGEEEVGLVSLLDLKLLEALDRNPAAKKKLLKQIKA